MYFFKGESVPSLYTKILDTVLNEGRTISPRGLLTKEIGPVIIEVTNPRKRLFGHPNRKEVSIFTYIEGLWILLKEASLNRVGHYVPAMSNYVHERTKLFDGAYGPAIGNQFELVYQRLKEDRDTRQAIVVINQPYLHKLPTKDYPCTLSYQFLIRDNKLDMIAYMRSQDAYLGLVYDQGEFQWFLEILAGWLGIDVGRYIHIDGSLHLYKKYWDKARLVVKKDNDWDLYSTATVLDARLPKEDFDIVLSNLGLWEEACRGTWGLSKSYPEKEYWDFKNEFYNNLADIILAYNLRLRGYKEIANEIIRGNNTDLGLIYRRRWLNE